MPPARSHKKIKYPYEYDPKIRQKSRLLERYKIAAALLGLVVPVFAASALLFLGWGTALRDLISSVPLGDLWYVRAILFALAFVATLDLAGFPVSIWYGFFVRKRFGLLTQKLGGRDGWLADYGKEFALSAIFAVIVVTGLYYLIMASAKFWWVYAAVASFVLGLFISFIWPKIVVPLFWKTEPWRDRRQIKRLLEMTRRAGAKELKTVLVAKESLKSKVANAWMGGLGKTKQIVVFDNLINNFTADEVETVVAHELGHYVHKDILKGAVFDAAVSFPIFYIVFLVLNRFASGASFGIQSSADVAGLPLIFLVFVLVGFVISPLLLAYSRRIEGHADWFALDATRKPGAYVSTEKRLSDIDLANDSPHPIVEFFFYSHPPTKKRIEMVKAWRVRREGKKRSADA